MKRHTILDRVMAEEIIFGGCVATRREVYEDCIGRGLSTRCADHFAFLPPALEADQPRPALTLAAVREFESRHLTGELR